MSAELGLLLLTGGRGVRLGGPKHDRAHPGGGSWGGHLVRVFQSVVPGGPVRLLGAPLPEAPDLPCLEDPRQGPAVALRTWAAGPDPEAASRWWVLACDLPRWTAADLEGWWRRAREADPGAEAWVVAEVEGRLQPLGGFLPSALTPALVAQSGTRLRDLLAALPHRILTASGACWTDVDDSEALEEFHRNAL